MVHERRSRYRLAPEREAALKAVLKSGLKEVPATEVSDLNSQGAGVNFRLADKPLPEVGGNVVLSFFSSAWKRPVLVKATVASRSETRSYCRYGLRFLEEVRAESEEDADLFRLFNRRGAYRAVQPDEAEPIDVSLTQVEPGGLSDTIEAQLKNISTTGIAVVVGAEIGDKLHVGSVVNASFRLFPSGEVVKVVAEPRNREESTDVVVYGFRFNPNRTENYLDQIEEITEYVMERYRHTRHDRAR